MRHELILVREVRAFLGAVFRGGVAYAAGGSVVAVAGTTLAPSVPGATTVRICAWVVLGAALSAGVFQAWRDEHRRRCGLEDTPQLRLRFVPGKAPYEQDASPHAEGRRNHYFRVGVTHDGTGQVEDVRVLLAALNPLPVGFPLLHCLAPMGEPNGKESCVVPSGSEPTRLFDVLVQVRQPLVASDDPDRGPREVLQGVGTPAICFAAGDRTVPARPKSIRLVVEGRNAHKAELFLEMAYTGPGQVLQLRPVAPTAALHLSSP